MIGKDIALGENVKMLDLGDRLFYLGQGKGEVFLTPEDAFWYRERFGLGDFDAGGICELRYDGSGERPKIDMIDASEKIYQDVAKGDPDFTLGYFFPQLEGIAGGMYSPPKIVPTWKKVLLGVAIFGLVGMLTGLSSCISPQQPTEETAAQSKFGAAGDVAVAKCITADKVKVQLNNCFGNTRETFYCDTNGSIKSCGTFTPRAGVFSDPALCDDGTGCKAPSPTTPSPTTEVATPPPTPPVCNGQALTLGYQDFTLDNVCTYDNRQCPWVIPNGVVDPVGKAVLGQNGASMTKSLTVPPGCNKIDASIDTPQNGRGEGLCGRTGSGSMGIISVGDQVKEEVIIGGPLTEEYIAPFYCKYGSTIYNSFSVMGKENVILRISVDRGARWDIQNVRLVFSA